MDTAGRSKKALSDLDQTFPDVIRALEHGLLEARAYFDSTSVGYDAAVFSTIVRLHARSHLKARQLNTADLEVEQVNLCGLWLKVGRYHIKIWKIGREDLSKALAREASGEQMQLVDHDGIPIVVDLAIYWTMDETHCLGEMYLVQPKYDDPRCFEWIWSRAIPQNAMIVEPVVAGDIPIEDLGIEAHKSNR